MFGCDETDSEDELYEQRIQERNERTLQEFKLQFGYDKVTNLQPMIENDKIVGLYVVTSLKVFKFRCVAHTVPYIAQTYQLYTPSFQTIIESHQDTCVLF